MSNVTWDAVNKFFSEVAKSMKLTPSVGFQEQV